MKLIRVLEVILMIVLIQGKLISDLQNVYDGTRELTKQKSEKSKKALEITKKALKYTGLGLLIGGVVCVGAVVGVVLSPFIAFELLMNHTTRVRTSIVSIRELELEETKSGISSKNDSLLGPSISKENLCMKKSCECKKPEIKNHVYQCVLGDVCTVKDNKPFCQSSLDFGDTCQEKECVYFTNPTMEKQLGFTNLEVFKKDTKGNYEKFVSGNCSMHDVLFMWQNGTMACNKSSSFVDSCDKAEGCEYENVGVAYYDSKDLEEDESLIKTIKCNKGQTYHPLLFSLAWLYFKSAEEISELLKDFFDLRRYIFEEFSNCSDGDPALKPGAVCQKPGGCLYEAMSSKNFIMQIVCKQKETAKVSELSTEGEQFKNIPKSLDLQFLTCEGGVVIQVNQICPKGPCVCLKSTDILPILMEDNTVCIEEEGELRSKKLIDPKQICFSEFCRCQSKDKLKHLDCELFDFCVENTTSQALAVQHNILESHVCSDDACVCGGWKEDKTSFCKKDFRCLGNGTCALDGDILDDIIVKNSFKTFTIIIGQKETKIECKKGQFWRCNNKNEGCACHDEKKQTQLILDREVI